MFGSTTEKKSKPAWRVGSIHMQNGGLIYPALISISLSFALITLLGTVYSEWINVAWSFVLPVVVYFTATFSAKSIMRRYVITDTHSVIIWATALFAILQTLLAIFIFPHDDIVRLSTQILASTISVYVFYFASAKVIKI